MNKGARYTETTLTESWAERKARRAAEKVAVAEAEADMERAIAQLDKLAGNKAEPKYRRRIPGTAKHLEFARAVCKAYEDGMPYKDMYEKFGCSASTIHRTVAAMGVQQRKNRIKKAPNEWVQATVRVKASLYNDLLRLARKEQIMPTYLIRRMLVAAVAQEKKRVRQGNVANNNVRDSAGAGKLSAQAS